MMITAERGVNVGAGISEHWPGMLLNLLQCTRQTPFPPTAPRPKQTLIWTSDQDLEVIFIVGVFGALEEWVICSK